MAVSCLFDCSPRQFRSLIGATLSSKDKLITRSRGKWINGVGLANLSETLICNSSLLKDDRCPWPPGYAVRGK